MAHLADGDGGGLGGLHVYRRMQAPGTFTESLGKRTAAPAGRRSPTVARG
ncbi:MAG: hypothetical protein ACRDQ7_00635 [Haloechinothrix sp.]